MKHFLALLLMLNTAVAFGAFPRHRDIQFELNQSPFGQHVHLGTMIEDKVPHVLRAQWSFADQGGANNATIDLKDIDGKKAVLPPGAIVKNCVILVDAALGSAGSAVVQFSTGQSLEDVKPQTAYTSFGTNDGLVGCQVSGGTVGSWVKLPGNYTAEYTAGYTSEYTPTMKITGAALTRGKVRVLLEYILSR